MTLTEPDPPMATERLKTLVQPLPNSVGPGFVLLKDKMGGYAKHRLWAGMFGAGGFPWRG